MSKLKLTIIGGAFFLLAGCGLTIADVAAQIVALVADPAKGCSLIVNTEQLIKALTGLDPSKIDVIAFVNNICSQVVTAQDAPLSSVRKTAKENCYNVVVMGKPVEACKTS